MSLFGVNIFGGPTPYGESQTVGLPVLPAKDNSLRAVEVECDMYKARAEAELERAAEARRREMAAVAELREARIEHEEAVKKMAQQVAAVLADAGRALTDAKRKIEILGRAS